MAYDILCIGVEGLQPRTLEDSLGKDATGEFHVRQVGSMEEAEPFLFENRVCLIVADSRVGGILETLSEIKKDEMMRYIPVVLITPDHDPEGMRRAYSFGVDSVIPPEAVVPLLPALVKPFIKGFLIYEELLQKTAELHEASIHDFILVDLIKDYIPRTIWDIAKAYAHLQKITIPEEETELTVVFADIKGFTAITQHMPPRDVIKTLNTVFDVATRIVYRTGGDIDKFIGDAFFAVYRDAKTAVESMVQLQRELKAMNALSAFEGKPVIQFRIGIHTGPVIRGNVGGNNRFDNTLIGDTVNMASRLERIAPAGGVVISEETMKKAGFSIPRNYMKKEKLRGRDVEDTFYEVFEHLQ